MDCLPHFVQGKVVSGFGRGSKELGIPTANFSSDLVEQLPEKLESGVYYGWASVDGICGVHKMVASIGWNVFYGNKVKTMETHIMKQFEEDFYGENLRIVILGFVRPMLNFDSLDALITAIHSDIRTAEEELSKPENLTFKGDDFFIRDLPHRTNKTDDSATPETDQMSHLEDGCDCSSESRNKPNKCSSKVNSSDSLPKQDPVNETTLTDIYHIKGSETCLSHSTDKESVPFNDEKLSKEGKLKNNIEIQNSPVSGLLHSSQNGTDLLKNVL